MPWIVNPKHIDQPNPRRYSVSEEQFKANYKDWIVVDGPDGPIPRKSKSKKSAEEPKAAPAESPPAAEVRKPTDPVPGVHQPVEGSQASPQGSREPSVGKTFHRKK